MPELPEVETTCRDILNSPFMGQTVRSTSVLWHRTIGGMEERKFVVQILGRKCVDVGRRGKYIHMKLDDGQSLLVHLRMSGSLSVRPISKEPDLHDRVIIQGETHELVFHDPRKFGRMTITSSPEILLGKLGPEPFNEELSNGGFHRILHLRRSRIKTILLNQNTIAGIGNIYADESLFSAGIHPMTPGNALLPEESERLLQAIRTSLINAIESRGTSLGTGEGNFSSAGHAGENGGNLMVFQRTGKPCSICNTPIERIIVNQRSTHVCPRCQIMKNR